MKAIDAKKAYPFVVKDEKNKSELEQTVFMCKYLDPTTAAALGDQVYSVKGVGTKRTESLLTGTQQLNILKSNLVGWRNFKDEDGRDIEFDKNNPVEMIAKIPPPYRSEIADFIRGESEIEEGESKS